MPQHRRSPGFTIIELLIALVIVGVIAAVALPSFQNSLRKGRRSEAYTALGALQQAQERWRSSNGAYAENSQLSLGVNDESSPGLGQAATTPSGYYTIAIADGADASSYTATATAVEDTSQAVDSHCTVLAVRMQGGNIGYGSGATIDWTDAYKCWAR